MYYPLGNTKAQVKTTAQAAWAIANDPHLPEFVCQVLQLVPEDESEGRPAHEIVQDIATDPHLSEVVCHVMRLQALEGGAVPQTACQKIPVNYQPGKGIGLRYAVVPLRYLVAARQNPGVALATVGAVVGGIFLLGYITGKGR